MSEQANLPATPPHKLPGKAKQHGWHRLHPLSPLLQGGLVLVIIAGIVIANLRDEILAVFVEHRVGHRFFSDDGDLIGFLVEHQLLLTALIIVFTTVLLIIMFSWLNWHFYTYRITDEAVEMRKGMIFTQHRRAPLKRIQSVNLKRPLLARIFSLTQVEVHTAGQGGNVNLAYLSHREAKQLREQILHRAAHSRTQAEPHPHPTPPGQPAQWAHDFIDQDLPDDITSSDPLLKVPVKRLIASIMISWEFTGIALLAILILLAAQSAMLLGRYWAATGAYTALVPIAIVMVGIFFNQFDRGFNFTLSRSANSVRVASGLTSTNTETIPARNIHSIEARQPLGWRPFGWWKMRVNTAGRSTAEAGQNQVQNIVLPVGGESDVLRVFETLLPAIKDQTQELQALRDGLTGPQHNRDDGYLRAGRHATWVLLWGRRRTGITLMNTVHSDGSANINATLRIRRGALTRSFSIMPIVRAQSVQLRRPLLHRMTGLATISTHTVLGPVVMRVRGIDVSQAQLMFDTLADCMVRVQATESAARAATTAQQPFLSGAHSAQSLTPAASAPNTLEHENNR